MPRLEGRNAHVLISPVKTFVKGEKPEKAEKAEKSDNPPPNPRSTGQPDYSPLRLGQRQ